MQTKLIKMYTIFLTLFKTRHSKFKKKYVENIQITHEVDVSRKNQNIFRFFFFFFFKFIYLSIYLNGLYKNITNPFLTDNSYFILKVDFLKHFSMNNE